MIRLDYFLLGYVTVKIPKESIKTVSVKLLKREIPVKITHDGSFNIPVRRVKSILPLLSGIEYTVSEPRGVYGFLYPHRKRYGAFLAFAVSIVLFLIMNSLVWDIRIEGTAEENEEKILSDLADSGLYVGAAWRNIDNSRVEARALLASDEIAWLNINRRGTVAYVTVVDRVTHEQQTKPTGYANVVAARDCIIEEITVKSGVAVVKKGESVRQGQLLISGVLPQELGGGYCYAEGSVKGRYADTVSVTVPAVTTEKIYIDEKIGALTLNFFGFPINILKIGGNSQTECDIIEKKKEFALFGKDMPLSAEYKILRPYTETELTLTADKLTELAAEQLRRELLGVTEAADLLSIRTSGGFADDGYAMQADIICRSEVSETREFKVNLE
ncbi:MAG: sporulation protein YqfD [Clostridia bacterium]|nr:sporulation protein YqfD [Clostridia bacterium]